MARACEDGWKGDGEGGGEMDEGMEGGRRMKFWGFDSIQRFSRSPPTMRPYHG